MMGGAYTLSRNGHVRGDFLYRLWQPQDAGARSTSRSTSSSSSPASPPDLCGLEIRRAVVGLRRGLDQQPGRHPDLPVQDGDRGRGHPALHPGHRPGLRCILHAHRRMAAAAEDVEETRRSDRSRPPRNRLLIRRPEAAKAERGKTRPDAQYDGPPGRPADAGALHRLRLPGLSHRLHADGDGHRLWLLRLFRRRPHVARFNRLDETAGWWESTTLWIEGFFNNRIFDLFVNQTYTVMSNEVLTAVPAVPVHGLHRRTRQHRRQAVRHAEHRRPNMPGSMGVAALVTCALFATATGIVGAVVTLMGLLALPVMLKARYNPSSPRASSARAARWAS
jgi:hypothetical protein